MHYITVCLWGTCGPVVLDALQWNPIMLTVLQRSGFTEMTVTFYWLRPVVKHRYFFLLKKPKHLQNHCKNLYFTGPHGDLNLFNKSGCLFMMCYINEKINKCNLITESLTRPVLQQFLISPRQQHLTRLL